MRHSADWNIVWTLWLGCTCCVAVAQDPTPVDRDLRHRIRRLEADESAVRTTESLDADRKILAALQKPVQTDWVNQPLEQILVRFHKAAGIDFVVDRAAFVELKADPNPAVTCEYGEVTVLYALNRLGLVWSLQGEDVLLRPAGFEEVLFTRAYDISKVSQWLNQSGVDQLTEVEANWSTEVWGEPGETATRPLHRGHLLRRTGTDIQRAERVVAELVKWTSGREWMPREYRGGSMQIVPNRLFVRQSFAAHLDIAGTLDSLEQLTTGDGTLRPAQFRRWGTPVAEEATLESALNTKVSFRFENVKFEDALKHFRKTPGFRYHINQDGIGEDQVEQTPPVTLELNDVKLRTALGLILEPARLASLSHEGILEIVPAGREQCSVLHQLIGYRVDQIPLASDRQTLANLIQQQTSGKWMDLDQEGGRMIWIGPKILLVQAEPKVQVEVASLLRELGRPPAANGAALVKPVEMPPRFEIRLYKFGTDQEAKELRRALPLAVENPEQVRAIRRVGKQLVVEASPAGHTLIDKFLRSLSASELAPAGTQTGAGAGFFSVPSEEMTRSP